MTTTVEKKQKGTSDTTKKSVATKAVKKVSSYIEGIGRRKTATARVRISEASKESMVVNGKTVNVYFPTAEMQTIVADPIVRSKIPAKFSVSVLVRGGGIHAQAEAVRHGLSRSLIKYDEETKSRLKKLGFLKRDPRMKERRKFGLKKARKAPQWSKR